MIRPECERLLQQRLDGAGDPSAWQRHLDDCDACRDWHLLAERLEDGLRALPPVVPPDGLAKRVVAQVLAERERRTWQHWGWATAGVAAGLVLAASTFGPWQETGPVDEVAAVVRPHPEPSAIPSLRGHVAEAGSAVASLTRRTADEALEQTWLLLPTDFPSEAPPEESFPQTLASPARSLLEAGQAVAMGLDPVAVSARRAFDLFVREAPPSEPAAKRGS